MLIYFFFKSCFLDVDECLTDQDDCDNNATCTNLIPSFTCDCDIGFTGNGTHCYSKIISTILDYRTLVYPSPYQKCCLFNFPMRLVLPSLHYLLKLFTDFTFPYP